MIKKLNFNSMTKGFFRNRKVAIAIGVFDAIHLGHRIILERCVKAAREKGAVSIAVTFDRNPKLFFTDKKDMKKLVTDRKKDELLEQIGIDYNLVIDFSLNFSRLSGVEFIDMMVNNASVVSIVVGEDFRCGSPGDSMDGLQIREYLNAHSKGCEVLIPRLLLNDRSEVISSTILREKLNKGALAEVRGMLGRLFDIDLRDVPYEKIENGLLFQFGQIDQLLPPGGTWYGRSECGNVTLDISQGKVRVTKCGTLDWDECFMALLPPGEANAF